uniref:Uncharacterized protein n=1 Tax=Arion vulgaris TaxID=1028688 RepID=A0A0B7B136_9EUPU
MQSRTHELGSGMTRQRLLSRPIKVLTRSTPRACLLINQSYKRGIIENDNEVVIFVAC